jgi:hypothetical protein
VRLSAPGRASLIVCLALTVLCPTAARATRPLELGFFDAAFAGAHAMEWLHRSVEAGAGIIRIDIGWVAPNTSTRPAGFNARDPADPHYDFSTADREIRQATSAGLKVLVDFTGAPQWAEGPGMPPDVAPGTWEPSPQALEQYGAALAKRYSGRFPDPAHPGQRLPRAAAFQMWNEPNLGSYLNPQWSGTRPESPLLYRAMLNAFYRGVKSVDPRGVVVTAGTAPYGDPPGLTRMMPVLFWRTLLCLRERGSTMRADRCPNPAHFDVMAHDPYSVGSPSLHAFWPDEASIPDLGKLTGVLHAAERAGTVLPRDGHPLWITEVGYNSYPPDPGGVPIQEQARWLEQTLEELWQGGAAVVIWTQVGDNPPVPSYGETNQSGVYYLDGRAKPALTAYQFPLVARRAGSVLLVWGRTPAAGRLQVQRQVGGRWETVATLDEAARATFAARVPGHGRASLRGRLGEQTSLVWTVS